MSKKLFDPNLWSLEKLFESVYIVPVYQRPYSWEDEQINTLIDDIFNAYFTDSDKDEYYTGNIIIHELDCKIDGRIQKYEIVDGQQRITSFVLMLLALYSLSLVRNADINDNTVLILRKMLWKIITDRKPTKEYPVLKLNSVESQTFDDLINAAFDKPKDLFEFAINYETNSKFEDNVISNFINIYNKISNRLYNDNNAENILDFADFFYRSIYVISIISTAQENKVFSMFESINSKGKKLDEIDLIKSFIFSKLNTENYSEYLEKWGQLIRKTKDNLYDYLSNYIKANIVFYRNNISILNFKTICEKQLLTYFNTNDVSVALAKLIDDMVKKEKFYRMLSCPDLAFDLIKNNEFRFYYRVFTSISFKHPRALFFKTMIDFEEEKINKENAKNIIITTIKFMLQSLSISNIPSKDVITMFQYIMEEIYYDGKVCEEKVVKRIVSELVKQGITDEKLKIDLKSIDAYETNKKLTIALLSLFEASEVRENKQIKISFDQAYLLLSNFSTDFSLDHLLAQTPEKKDNDYKYYLKKDGINQVLVLKDGHDFPTNVVQDGMDYSMFTKIILNKIGNLRLYYKDKNSNRKNEVVELKEYKKFTKFADVELRSNYLADMIIDNFLGVPKISVKDLQTNTPKIRDKNFPKMYDLLKMGLIKPGDKICITINPDESVATLIDSKYVDFNGKIMTFNDWGCKVTGWKSIRIYMYVTLVGENETLHSKRLKILEEKQFE